MEAVSAPLIVSDNLFSSNLMGDILSIQTQQVPGLFLERIFHILHHLEQIVDVVKEYLSEAFLFAHGVCCRVSG